MFCQRCGQELTDNAVICPQCGKSTWRECAQPVPSASPIPPYGQYGLTCPRCGAHNITVSSNTHTESKSRSIIWNLLMILLTAGIWIIWMLIRKRKEEIVTENIAVCQSCGNSWKISTNSLSSRKKPSKGAQIAGGLIIGAFCIISIIAVATSNSESVKSSKSVVPDETLSVLNEEADKLYEEGNIIDALSAAENAYSSKNNDTSKSIIKKCKDDLLEKLESKTEKEVDNIDDITYVYNKGANRNLIDFNCYAYIVWKEKSNPTFRICIGFGRDEWIFMEKVKFKSNQNAFEFDVSYSERSTEIGDSGKIFEWTNKTLDVEDRAALSGVLGSDKTVVRFYGDEYYLDKELSDAKKKNIRFMLVYYYLLTDIKGESYCEMAREFIH